MVENRKEDERGGWHILSVQFACVKVEMVILT